ncbi:hypothetical protein BHF71_08475 [Vulcanibacillus modesticaldus]|uniref:Uncharacterized protein n=1 Tax=Vulcanibacillus modesticaldus TaxID=337097 RepID=A0A1D2YV30_9BACI|nr:hypothetical protein [Vulcanibacillus modesticaldus]OEF99572.1 hypothetical protein BHF71_08475 [Vulcanibacillus modesticaldus]
MWICNHLKPIIDHELSKGNKIQEISKGWSNAVLVIDLEKRMDVQYERSDMNLSEYVKYWENKDSHYPLQKGFYCEKCKHSIAGPY